MFKVVTFRKTCVAVAIGQMIAGSAQGAVISVTSDRDDNGDGCTLREAIISVNTVGIQTGGCVAGNGSSDKIVVDGDVISTITLTQQQSLVINQPVEIVNSGSELIRVDGIANGRHSVFVIDSAVASISGFQIFNGNAQSYGGGVYLNNHAQLTLNYCGVNSNTGGGIYLTDNSTITVRNSNIYNNNNGYGGGIYARGEGSSATLINSTVSGNNVNDTGGGIYVSQGADLTLINSTVSNNRASAGGGGIAVNGGGNLNIQNSLISGNTAAASAEISIAAETTFSSEYNLFGDDRHSRDDAFRLFSPSELDRVATNDSEFPLQIDEILKPLADHGGFTLSHSLPFDSSALDAASQTICTNNAVTSDQRGLNRDASCDIGAFEAIKASILVDSSLDDDAGCTLRRAVESVNNRAGQLDGCENGADLNTISFHLPSPSQIDLTQNQVLEITSDVIINGPGATNLIVDAMKESKVFAVDSAQAKILGITISGGQAGSGAGITARNGAKLTVKDSLLTANRATATGGAISGTSASSIVIERTAFTNNLASIGGAIALRQAALGMRYSTLFENSAFQEGGAVDFSDSSVATIVNTTVSGNTAYNSGGGVKIGGNSNVVITNSTISDNTTVQRGGGIFIRNSSLTLGNALVSGNESNLGAELLNFSGTSTISSSYNLFGHAELTNSDAIRNFTPNITDITGTIDGNTTTDLNDIFKPLAKNGDSHEIHALISGSPAINGGAQNVCPLFDQRSQKRNNQCDIGAYEFIEESCFVVRASNGNVLTFCL